jgi:hypothetical protein
MFLFYHALSVAKALIAWFLISALAVKFFLLCFDNDGIKDIILAFSQIYVFQSITLAVKIHDSSINILQSESHRDGILDSNLQLHKVIESCRDGISDSIPERRAPPTSPIETEFQIDPDRCTMP